MSTSIELRLLTGITGDNFSHVRGDVARFPLSDAIGMVREGFAQTVDKEGEEILETYRNKLDTPPEPVPASPLNAVDESQTETDGEDSSGSNSTGETGDDSNSSDETESTTGETVGGGTPVDDLDLDSSTIAVLTGVGLKTVEVVRAHPDLTTIKGIGPKTATAIYAACDQLVPPTPPEA